MPYILIRYCKRLKRLAHRIGSGTGRRTHRTERLLLHPSLVRIPLPLLLVLAVLVLVLVLMLVLVLLLVLLFLLQLKFRQCHTVTHGNFTHTTFCDGSSLCFESGSFLNMPGSKPTGPGWLMPGNETELSEK